MHNLNDYYWECFGVSEANKHSHGWNKTKKRGNSNSTEQHIKNCKLSDIIITSRNTMTIYTQFSKDSPKPQISMKKQKDTNKANRKPSYCNHSITLKHMGVHKCFRGVLKCFIFRVFALLPLKNPEKIPCDHDVHSKMFCTQTQKQKD